MGNVFHSELVFLYGYTSIFQVTLINIYNQVKNAQYTHLRRTFMAKGFNAMLTHTH